MQGTQLDPWLGAGSHAITKRSHTTTKTRCSKNNNNFALLITEKEAIEFGYERVLKFCTVPGRKKKKTPLKWYIVLALPNANRFFLKGLALEFKGHREQRWGREKARSHSEDLLQVNWVLSLTRIFSKRLPPSGP